MNRTIKRVIIGSSGLIIGVYSGYRKIKKKKPCKYSMKWIQNLTDNEWTIERRKVQQRFNSPKYSELERNRFQNLLRCFDKVKSERDWGVEKPVPPSFHREHGWYL